VPATEAVERIRRLPIRVMVEPAIDHLSGAGAHGAFWSYVDVDGAPELTARVRAGVASVERTSAR
jgi:hypothetical protein